MINSKLISVIFLLLITLSVSNTRADKSNSNAAACLAMNREAVENYAGCAKGDTLYYWKVTNVRWSRDANTSYLDMYISKSRQVPFYPLPGQDHQCVYDPEVLQVKCPLENLENDPNPPDGPPPNGPSNNSIKQCGSIISVDQLTVGESVPVVGTPFSLNYVSDRVSGRLSNYKIKQVITNPTVDLDLHAARIEAVILGRSFFIDYNTILPNITFNFTWDGLDASMNEHLGSAVVDTTFKQWWTSGAVDFPRGQSFVVGQFNSIHLGMGGWNLDVVHFYDKARDRVWYGDGSTYSAYATQDGTGHYVPSPDGKEIYYFDSTGRITQTKTALTGSTKYLFVYNSAGHLTSITDASGNVTTINRNLSGVMTGITSPYGQVTSVTVGSNNYLSSITNPANETYSMTYYSGGLIHTFQKPRGQVSTFTYDADGKLLTDLNSAGNSLSFVEQITEYWGRSVNMTSAEGRGKTFTFLGDYSNFQKTIYHEDSSTESWNAFPNDWDSTLQAYAENAARTTKTTSTFTTKKSDSRLGRAVMNPTSTQFYYTNGSGSVVIDEDRTVTMSGSTPGLFDIATIVDTSTVNNKTTSTTYDGALKRFTTTTPLSRTFTRNIDVKERTTSAQWANLASVSYAYDTNGRLSGVTQGARSTSFGYDLSGRLSTLTNALSQVTSYLYDNANRVTQTTLPDSRVIGFTYDPNGNLTSITPPSKPSHNFLNNMFDLESSYQPPALGSSTVNTSYTYNNDKQLTSITRPDGQTINFAYVSGNSNLESVTSGSAAFLFENYASGLPTRVTSPDGLASDLGYSGTSVRTDQLTNASTFASMGSTEYTVNNELQIDSEIVRNAAGNSTSTIAYQYDNDGFMKKAGNQTLTLNATNGLVSGTTLDTITDSYGYNSFGEVTSYAAVKGATALYSYSLVRDNLGRVTQKTETIGGVTDVYDYTYDLAGRLTTVLKNSAPFNSYTYDSNSNRTGGSQNGASITATYDNQDRLLTYNNKTFTYNLNGDLQTVAQTGLNTKNYVYDVFGNLKSVSQTGATTINYQIDGLNRRAIRKTGTTVTARYLYSQGRVVAELNNSGGIVNRYVYSTKKHAPDYMTKSGTRYRIITDHVGSVRLVVKASDGVIGQRIDYDEFGRVLSDTSPGFQAFGFAGGLYDSATWLTRFGARDYDASVGRWTSKDPIKFAGADSNLYGYVFQDPINWIDVDGEFGMRINPNINPNPGPDSGPGRSDLDQQRHDILMDVLKGTRKQPRGGDLICDGEGSCKPFVPPPPKLPIPLPPGVKPPKTDGGGKRGCGPANNGTV